MSQLMAKMSLFKISTFKIAESSLFHQNINWHLQAEERCKYKLRALHDSNTDNDIDSDADAATGTDTALILECPLHQICVLSKSSV